MAKGPQRVRGLGQDAGLAAWRWRCLNARGNVLELPSPAPHPNTHASLGHLRFLLNPVPPPLCPRASFLSSAPSAASRGPCRLHLLRVCPMGPPLPGPPVPPLPPRSWPHTWCRVCLCSPLYLSGRRLCCRGVTHLSFPRKPRAAHRAPPPEGTHTTGSFLPWGSWLCEGRPPHAWVFEHVERLTRQSCWRSQGLRQPLAPSVHVGVKLGFMLRPDPPPKSSERAGPTGSGKPLPARLGAP